MTLLGTATLQEVVRCYQDVSTGFYLRTKTLPEWKIMLNTVQHRPTG